MMVVAYGDESADERVYVVSGLLAYLPEWVELERRWRAKLNELKLVEFHAAKCEQRLRPFEHYDRQRRDSYQREFYTLLAKAPVWGFSTAVWHAAYKTRKDDFALRDLGPDGDYTSPYFLAFQHVIEKMCRQIAPAAPSERIAFVFDQHKEFEGRAQRLYDSLCRTTSLDFVHRLGSLTFASRFCQIQLQAADVWAYESRKHVADVLIDHRPDDRWQYWILRDTNRFHIDGFPPEAQDRLLPIIKEDRAEKDAAARAASSGV